MQENLSTPLPCERQAGTILNCPIGVRRRLQRLKMIIEANFIAGNNKISKIVLPVARKKCAYSFLS